MPTHSITERFIIRNHRPLDFLLEFDAWLAEWLQTAIAERARPRRTIANVFSGALCWPSRATNETTSIKGQNSANQGMNVQEAIRYQTYYRTMLRTFRLSPLFARSN